MSGIGAEDKCVSEYNKFKMQNSSKGARRAYLLYRIKGEMVTLAQEGGADATWSDFVGALSADEKDGAYGVYDFHVETDDGRRLEKIIFVAWTPDSNLPIKKKMLYGSTREAFKGQLGGGIAFTIQATDISDLDEDEIAEMVRKGR